MYYEIFKFELQYRLRRPETYLFFIFLFLFSLGGVDFVFEGVELGPLKKNAPLVIAKAMGAITGIFIILVSMIMGVPILRDFEHGMESLLFINPISKLDYLLGRFTGSFLVLLFIFSGLLWGMMLGELMPWRTAQELMPFSAIHYIQPFCTIVLPLLFFGSTLFFVSGALSRKMIVVYTQGIFFFVFFLLTNAIENQFIAAVLDPFGLGTISYLTKLWTTPQRMTQLIPFSGVLLLNKLFWLGMTILVAIIGIYRFRFSVLKNKKSQKSKQSFAHQSIDLGTSAMTSVQSLYTNSQSITSLSIIAQFQQLIHHSYFHFISILRQVSFWGIVISGVVIIFINSINLGTVYGVNSHPATYLIMEELQEMSLYFFVILLIFYSGEIIWEERKIKFNLIYDALPSSSLLFLAGKFIALILTYVVLMIALIMAGILFQWTKGYEHIELSVYASGFFLQILPFLMLYSFISFFFQSLTNNKFISHLLVIAFFIVNIIAGVLGFDHNLINFGGGSLGIYSEMNGHSHFLKPYLWTQAYWLCFCLLLFIGTSVLFVRGTETAFKTRLALAKSRFSPKLKQLTMALTVVFIAIGGFIFYNTNILNEYWSTSTQQHYRAAYEKDLQHLQSIPKVSIVDVQLNLELHPSQRAYQATGQYLLYNALDQPINHIPIQKRIDYNTQLSEVQFSRETVLDAQYLQYDYYLYELEEALLPGDSLRFTFSQNYTSQGFEAGAADTELVDNGTFFKYSTFPIIGYNSKYELSDDDQRKAFGLSIIDGMADRNDEQEVQKANEQGDRQAINFEITIGTEEDQIAIAPGKLQQEWHKNNRRYFNYQMEASMINFYAILSASYAVKKDSWNQTQSNIHSPIDLEIYHHPTHDYNVDRMMDAMKRSLDYYQTYFGSYPYSHLRIMEFPRYDAYAQSFPGTIPFSESLGFILDIDDETEVDMAFFITAHETAHQWWGLQVLAANVQGQSMILESLSQYSALMVFEKKYGAVKTQQLLAEERKAYFKGRSSEKKVELPLSKVEDQEYLYYRKGGLNLYALQKYISEEQVNLALQEFFSQWNALQDSFPKNRYATTKDLIEIIRSHTPDALQYVVTDLFEKVIRYDNKINNAQYSSQGEDQFLVQLELQLNKFSTDSLGQERKVPINDWVDIGIYAKNEQGEVELIYLQKHWIEEEDKMVEILVNRKPSQAGIDPSHILLDQKMEDNVLQME